LEAAIEVTQLPVLHIQFAELLALGAFVEASCAAWGFLRADLGDNVARFFQHSLQRGGERFDVRITDAAVVPEVL
jgi:hypothetical protein